MVDNDHRNYVRSERDAIRDKPAEGLGKVAEKLEYAAASRLAFSIDAHPQHKINARFSLQQARTLRQSESNMPGITQQQRDAGRSAMASVPQTEAQTQVRQQIQQQQRDTGLEH